MPAVPLTKMCVVALGSLVTFPLASTLTFPPVAVTTTAEPSVVFETVLVLAMAREKPASLVSVGTPGKPMLPNTRALTLAVVVAFDVIATSPPAVMLTAPLTSVMALPSAWP